MKVHHIAVAVESVEAAAPSFRELLGEPSGPEQVVTDQKVKTLFFSAGDCRVELLEATAPDSPVARFLERRGSGLHHVAFTVPKLEKALEDLARAGLRVVDSEPRMGAGGERIAFLHPESFSGVLIELMEER